MCHNECMGWNAAFWINVLAAVINFVGAILVPNPISVFLFFVSSCVAMLIHVKETR